MKNNLEELSYIAGEVLLTPALVGSRWRLRSRNVKPIGYIGWLGHRNLGDEAMFQAIRRTAPELRIAAMLPAPGEKLVARVGLSGRNFFRAILVGGGTLINPLMLPAAQLARSFGVPLHTVGTGVGSAGFGMPPETSLAGWAEVLGDSIVAVRGPLSARALHEAGVTHAFVIGDPALGLTPDHDPPFRTRNRLVINLACEQPSDEIREYRKFLAVGRIAQRFLKSGGEVVGVALGNGDRATLLRFRDAHGLHDMRIENHRTSGEGLLRTISGSIGLIGVRLHAAVLATCVGVPPLLFAYRKKCEDFMLSMDIPALAVPDSEEESSGRLEELWNCILARPDLGQRIFEKARYWKQKQFRFFRDVISPEAGSG